MSKRFASVTRGLAIMLISTFLLAYLMFLAGARINTTPSLPKGLYWCVDKSPAHGDIVVFSPVDDEVFREARKRHYIGSGAPNGFGQLMKVLVAADGDVVDIAADGIAVNGQPIPNTSRITHDSTGAPMPILNLHGYRLAPDEVLLISNHLPISFDGRYFGIQKTSQISAVVTPVLTW